MSDEITLSSPATESRVLAYLNSHGAPAMQICAERGVTAASFYTSAALKLFTAAAELHARGLLIEGGTELCEEAVLRQKCMDWQTFVELTKALPCSGIMSMQMPNLCRELRRLEKRRALKHAGMKLAQALRDQNEEEIAVAKAEINAADITERPRASWHQTGGVEIDRAVAIIAGKEDPDVRTIGWPWGIFDKTLQPFHRAEQVVVAGYTSNGKSSLLRQLCMSAAQAGHNIAFVSMEVPAADIFNLMGSATSGQPYSRLKGLHPRDQSDFVAGCQRVRGMSIEVLTDESSLSGIIAWVRNQNARRFLDVVAIDYLGLVSECSPQKGQTKAAAVGEVAAAFKRLATELQVVLFLAVQINRGPTTDGNREPRLSDLKDSGDIEAHADRVLLLFRPTRDKSNNTEQHTHDSIEDRPRYYTELFQEKGRNVGEGHGALWLRRELARFELIT